MVRVQSPWPDAATANGGVRSERFYYDGARRIQELVTDPMATIELVQGSNSQGQNLELGELMIQTVPPPVLANGDGSATPLSFESAQLNNPGETIGSGGAPLPESLTGIEREYIWGPGDNGLDELLVQFDINRAPWWMIQDAGGDIVAMCDLNGSGGTARVVHTWQYDAYGQCLRADQLVTDTSTYKIPQNRCGHKGLFMDRLDVGIANPTTYADNPRLAPFSTVLYQNRNRTYSPQLGRFIQRDPNETGQLLAAMQGYMGGIPTGSGGSFDINGQFGDGGSLYGYLRNNPTSGEDPMGLEFALVGRLVVAAGMGATMGAVMTPIANMARGKTTDLWDGVGTNMALGAGMAVLGAASPLLGVGIAGYGVGSSFGEFMPILVGRNSTMTQRMSAASMMLMSVAGAGLAVSYAQGSAAMGRLSGIQSADDAFFAQAARGTEPVSLAGVFKGSNPGRAFAVVYDAVTGRVGMRPSADGDVVPSGWVPRRGGHEVVAESIGAGKNSYAQL